MIKQLAHICIRTSDLDLSEKFYVEVLGMRKQFSFHKNDKAVGFYLSCGGATFVEVVLSKNENLSQKNSCLQHFCFEVENLDAAIVSVRERGWEISDKFLGEDSTWHALLKDPNGVQLEFHQYSSKSSQLNHADCNVTW